MIFLTRLDKQEMCFNPDHIVSIAETPDTVITLFNGNHFIVKERASIVIARIVAFRARIIRRAGTSKVKKYLDKPKRSLFVNTVRNSQESFSRDLEEQLCSPIHFQDH
ncbi:MAG: flagellar FlbD family protein [Deltaproteobacteria bacterium]